MFLQTYANHPHYHAPRGATLNAKSWQTEAPLRMLLNNLDAAVAEDPEHLVVYGGIGQAARNVESLQKIIHALLNLEDNESLLIQSGKPVVVLPSHAEAPRVLIANSNLVPHWANWDEFRRLEALGLIMYGQMTAGSWIYIGTQGILQGTYETFAQAGKTHFQGNLKGNSDAFILKFDSSCVLKWATYYGGSKDECGYDVTKDIFNNADIVGNTRSTNVYKQNLPGAYNKTVLTTYGGAYILKFLQNICSSISS